MSPKGKPTYPTLHIDLMPTQLRKIERLGFRVKGSGSSRTVRIDLTPGQLKKLEAEPIETEKPAIRRKPRKKA